MAEGIGSLSTWPSIRNIVLAVLGPILLQASLMLIAGGQEWHGAERAEAFDIASLLISASVGFTFLAKQWKKYALLIALAYFPAMLFVLFFVSLGVQCDIYGNCL